MSRSAAIEAFKAAHLLIGGTPSGDTNWQIRVSKDPRKWAYKARQISEPAPHRELQSGLPLYHLHVEACISWQWAADFGASGEWEQATRQLGRIFLGAVPIDPIAPAESVWHVQALQKHPVSRYAFTQRPLYLLRLGDTFAISQPCPDLARNSIEKAITERVSARLHRGPSAPRGSLAANPIGSPIIDEAPTTPSYTSHISHRTYLH